MLPVSVPIVMITAHFLSQLIETPRNFQRKTFKAPFYLTVIFYILIVTLTWAGILFFLPFSQPPVGLLSLSTLSTFGLIFLFLFYKTKKYFSMIIALSIIQIITLTSLSGNSLSFFNRYPMKKFANQILADSQVEKRIGLYQLGNHRARMGVMTGLPSIYLNNPEELKLFIETQNNVYIVMRQSDWQSEFRDLPITITATDTGWRGGSIDKEEIELLLQDGLKSHLQEYSESYVLLKAKDKS
jgi:hypothetical protein